MHWWIYQSNTGKKEHPAEPPLCIRLLETSSWSVPKMRSVFGKCIVYSAGSIYLWHSSGGLDVDITTSGVSIYCCPWFAVEDPFRGPGDGWREGGWRGWEWKRCCGRSHWRRRTSLLWRSPPPRPCSTWCRICPPSHQLPPPLPRLGGNLEKIGCCGYIGMKYLVR